MPLFKDPVAGNINYDNSSSNIAASGVQGAIDELDDRNIWLTVSGDTGATAAGTSSDLLRVVGAGNVTTSMSAGTLTVSGTNGGGGDPDQNLWATITADSGSTTANTTTDTVNILGAGTVTTSINGDTVTVSGQSAVGGPNEIINIQLGSALTTGGGNSASSVIANDYPATEHANTKTTYGIHGRAMNRTPVADVEVKTKFILKATGTGTIVRIAVKTKSKATDEDSSAVFDDESFNSVTINTTNIGDIFETTVLIPSGIFLDDDTVALHIGRDGANVVAGPGASDDFNKAIQIIDIKLKVP